MKASPFLILCATGLAAIFSSTISKSPVLPLFAAHLGASPSGVGLVAAISAFAGVVFSVPAGILADRFGRKRLLLAAALIFATAPFAYLMVANLWQLALIRFYHGFATAIFVPVAMTMVAGLSRRERGEKLGWFSSATLTGRFLAPLTGGTILGLFTTGAAVGYNAVYLACGTMGALALLLTWTLPEEEAKPHHSSWEDTFRSFTIIIRDRRILLTCVVEAAILFAYGTFETFLPLYALDHGASPTQVGIFLSGQIIVLALTKPIMGRFSDSHGRRPQIVAGVILGSTCVGGFALATSFLPLFCLSLVFGLCLSVVTSATSAYIADLSRSEARGSAMGLLGSIMDIGHTSGPLLAGLIAAHFGYAFAFAGAGLVLLALGLVFLVSLGGGGDGVSE